MSDAETICAEDRARIDQWMRAAAAAYAENRLGEAEDLCTRVTKINPWFAPARHLQALILRRNGQLTTARDLCEQLLKHNTGYNACRLDFAIMLIELSDHEEAIRQLEFLLQVEPGNLAALYHLGVAHEKLGRVDDAKRAYEMTLQADPAHADACAALAQIAELHNHIELAETLTTRALKLAPDHVKARFTRAQLDYRAGRHSDAERYLRALAQADLSPVNRAVAFGRLAAVLERLGRYEDAFNAACRANETLAATNPGSNSDESPYSPMTIARLRRFFADAEMPAPATYTQIKEMDIQPVFLVGFPRSGTTLLDRILSQHSAITVLEEQEVLQPVISPLITTDDALRHFMNQPENALEPYRRECLQRFSARAGDRGDKRIIIDKLPLNTVHMGIIHRLLPEARFIFALRDPRDVCLSCFMQVFDLNQEMARFLTLQSTVEYYHAVMGLGLIYQRKLKLPIHFIRYEDLVADMQVEVTALLRFLRLEWEPCLSLYHEDLRGKYVNTPSYHQVARPIYTDSLKRWRHYESNLVPVLRILSPYIRQFGYDE